MAEFEGQTETITKSTVEEPPRYRVFMHNDDYTTMDFVVAVLKGIFHKSHDEAVDLMYRVHNNGIAQCGIYLLEIAETKVSQVHHEARTAGYPLKCSIEKV